MLAAAPARTALVRAVVVLLAVAFGALVGEGLVRGLRASSWLRGIGPFVLASDELLGWHYAAGSRLRHRGHGFDVTCRFDREGHRTTGRSADGRPLAVFVGDSLTFGWGVAAEHSFPFLLEDALGVDSVNLGVAGYGTDQSYLHLLAHGLPRHPVLVVFTHCGNDLDEVGRGRVYGRTKPFFTLAPGGALVLSPAGPRRPWLERRSELWRAARSRFERTFVPAPRLDVATSRRVVARLVREMAARASGSGARFVLVHQRSGWLGETLAGSPGGAPGGALEVDLEASFARATEPLSFERDPHWTRAAHSLAADEIRRALESAGWSPHNDSGSHRAPGAGA